MNNQQAIDSKKEDHNELVYSYLTLRNLIGFSGILLPIVLVLFSRKGELDKFIEPSISAYFYTSSGDLFVTVLCSIAVFLFTYRGYSWHEELILKLAAFSAVGVAFFPTASTTATQYAIHGARPVVPMIFGAEVHSISATIFFTCIGVLCLFYFTIVTGEITPSRRKRILVYKICGVLIFISIGILALYFTGNFRVKLPVPTVYLFETIAVEAFGIAWITKGHTLWPGGEHYVAKGLRKLSGK